MFIANEQYLKVLCLSNIQQRSGTGPERHTLDPLLEPSTVR